MKTTMKLSQIINKKTSGNSRPSGSPVAYNWIKSGQNKSPNCDKQSKCLVIYFSGEVLADARYRNGDRTDPEFDGHGNLIFPLGESGVRLMGKDGKKAGRSGRHIKFSHANAEADLSGLFPMTGRMEPLTVKSVSTGKITCRAPAQQ